MTEHKIQNQIRNALTDHGLFFRANVGQAQRGFLEAVKSNGGLAGVAWSVDDALEITGG